MFMNDVAPGPLTQFIPTLRMGVCFDTPHRHQIWWAQIVNSN